MKVKVAKWGNSLGIRLPSAAAQSVGATAGSELVLTVENGELRLKPSRKTCAELLAEMIAEMKRLGPENEPETLDWEPTGVLKSSRMRIRAGEITLDDLLSESQVAKPAAKRKARQSNARLRRR